MKLRNFQLSIFHQNGRFSFSFRRKIRIATCQARAKQVPKKSRTSPFRISSTVKTNTQAQTNGNVNKFVHQRGVI